MNLSRCENGHFYDKEKYVSCPHCSGGGVADNSLTTVFTEGVEEMGVSPVQKSSTEGTVPVDFTPEDTLPTAPPLPVSQPTVAAPGNMNPFDTPTVKLIQEDEFISSVDTIPVSEDDHTVAFFDDIFQNAAPVSETKMSGQMGMTVSSPCVGWLIAIGGVHIGQDFRLKVGKNFIGRDPGMDIAMTGDKSVSRNRHAIVVYEPKQHLYLIQPGESSALVYCNDEVVLAPVKLKPYDIITIGEINLLFLPLCGEQFNWSELLEEIARKNQ